MKKYEIMYIIKPLGEDIIENVVEKMNAIVTTNAGLLEKVEKWGQKHLAYEICGLDEGFYVLITLASDYECIKELDRNLRLDENVLRHMILRKD